jgi:hypothetical protein
VNCRTHTTSMASEAAPVRKSTHGIQPSAPCPGPRAGALALGSACDAGAAATTRLTASASPATSTLRVAATSSVRRNPTSSTSTKADASVPDVAPMTLAR